jgi:hypothetical protein
VREKQIFGLFVRMVGVLIFFEGGRSLWFSLVVWVWRADTKLVGGFPPNFGTYDLVYGLLVLVLGFTTIRWPEWIVRLAWPKELESSN